MQYFINNNSLIIEDNINYKNNELNFEIIVYKKKYINILITVDNLLVYIAWGIIKNFQVVVKGSCGNNKYQIKNNLRQKINKSIKLIGLL